MPREGALLRGAGCSLQACRGVAEGQPRGLPDSSPPWEAAAAAGERAGALGSYALGARGGPCGCDETEGARSRLPGAGATEGSAESQPAARCPRLAGGGGRGGGAGSTQARKVEPRERGPPLPSQEPEPGPERARTPLLTLVRPRCGRALQQKLDPWKQLDASQPPCKVIVFNRQAGNVAQRS